MDYFVNALDQTLTECSSFTGPIMELARNTAQVRFSKVKRQSVSRKPFEAAKADTNGHTPLNGHAIKLNGNGKAALNGREDLHNGSAQ